MTYADTLRKYSPKGLRCLIWLSFCVGAGMELFMSTVKVNGISFYDVAKRKKAERLVDQEEEMARLKALVAAKENDSKQQQQQ